MPRVPQVQSGPGQARTLKPALTAGELLALASVDIDLTCQSALGNLGCVLGPSLSRLILLSCSLRQAWWGLYCPSEPSIDNTPFEPDCRMLPSGYCCCNLAFPTLEAHCPTPCDGIHEPYT